MVDAGEKKDTPTQNQSSALSVLDKGTTGQLAQDTQGERRRSSSALILSQTARPTEVQASGKSLK